MEGLSDELLLSILDDYLSNPADWARWSATCRRFRRLGTPLCLDIVQEVKEDASSSEILHRYLPHPLFVEPCWSNEGGDHDEVTTLPPPPPPPPHHHHHNHRRRPRFLRAHVDRLHTNTKYRLWTYHARSNTRAYLSRNHQQVYMNQCVDGLAFHVDGVTNYYHYHSPSSSIVSNTNNDNPSTEQYWIFQTNNDNEQPEEICFVKKGTTTIDGNSNSDDIYCYVSTVGNGCRTACPESVYSPLHYYSPIHYYRLDTINSNPRTSWFAQVLPFTQAGGRRIGVGQLFRIAQYSQQQQQQVATTDHDSVQRVAVPRIAVQPRPFLSHNGGWNLYLPNAWESVLGTTVQNGSMIALLGGGGRSTCLHFHVWIQDSRFHIHAQYLVFPLSVPIFLHDPVTTTGWENNDKNNETDHERSAANNFLCAFLWGIFQRCDTRWYAIRHYLSMAANEVERLKYLTRQAGGREQVEAILPPPSRQDTVEDRDDDGSLGLTATHAANTWPPPRNPNPHYANEDNDDEYCYRARYVDDPDRPQRQRWNNVVHLCRSSTPLDDAMEGLNPETPSVLKDMSQPPWSIVFFA